MPASSVELSAWLAVSGRSCCDCSVCEARLGALFRHGENPKTEDDMLGASNGGALPMCRSAMLQERYGMSRWRWGWIRREHERDGGQTITAKSQPVRRAGAGTQGELKGGAMKRRKEKSPCREKGFGSIMERDNGYRGNFAKSRNFRGGGAEAGPVQTQDLPSPDSNLQITSRNLDAANCSYGIVIP